MKNESNLVAIACKTLIDQDVPCLFPAMRMQMSCVTCEVVRECSFCQGAFPEWAKHQHGAEGINKNRSRARLVLMVYPASTIFLPKLVDTTRDQVALV